jgi:hypothetical protein
MQVAVPLTVTQIGRMRRRRRMNMGQKKTWRKKSTKSVLRTWKSMRSSLL